MKTLRLIIFFAITFCISACSVMEDFVNHVIDSAPLDNSGTYHTYTQQEAIDMIMNTREAKAWNQSAASKGLFLASSGLSVIEDLTGKNFSFARGVMNATVDSLISDNNKAKSQEANLIGAAFYGTGYAIGYVEDMHTAEYNDDFLTAHQEEQENDPYFGCRYKIDEQSGRYVDVLKKYGMAEVQKCIREQQQMEAQQTLEEALALCNPFITQEDLDSLANGSEKDQDKRHKIIYDALKCYREYKRAEESNDDIQPHDGNDIINDDPNINQVINILDHSNDATEPNINDNSDLNSVSADNPSITNELELLEQTCVNAYKFNSYELSNENKEELDKAAEILERNPDIEIELLGHSCDIGEKEAKYIIGIQRAKKAKKYLIEKGVDAKRISVHSMGDKRPIAPNDSPANRAQNRRVEIIIIK